MSLEPVLIFFLLRYVRKNVVPAFLPVEEWKKFLRVLMYGVIALFIIQVVFSGTLMIWIWHLILVIIIAVIYKRPEFTAMRPVILAVLPLVALSIISDIIKLISNKLYLLVDSFFNVAFAVAVTWMIAMLLRSNKQQKALNIERRKTQEEEERSRFITAQKAELELLVAERTAELTHQKNELEHTLSELRNTQTQLVHSEKMASLGELTAGIAHEIQNPLNFVNNFSEVNAELIEEIRLEINKGNFAEAEVIANDIKENEKKITYHGKRADAIVKGMLQHSRKSSGQKEPTDINALAGEYLRLSYHGLRAKDKSFNARMQTNFDDSIEKVSVVAQEIGRVLLNLFNNAFYSVNEKKKLQPDNYEPTVSVSTKKLAGKIEVAVKDNGIGISQKVYDKIYQPFFTTKPTGQGTGLGLSISYDIIKSHGGEMRIESKEGEGAEFIIILPTV